MSCVSKLLNLLLQAAATEAELPIFAVNSWEFVSGGHQKGENLLRHLFEAARANSPSIVLLDEVLRSKRTCWHPTRMA